jgi:hypothetical protein
MKTWRSIDVEDVFDTLSRNVERIQGKLPETMIYLAAIRLMLNRIAPFETFQTPS